jgi:glycosyltransferase involved in cell wall biosynthesis
MTPVSCIIRTFNEERHLGALLRSLRGQAEYGPTLDIVVVDSGSTDGTRSILAEHGIVPIDIARDEFNYSVALNLGISRSRHELIVVLSGHAVPCDDKWIATIVRHFDRQDVAGVYCRQQPWPGADLHESLRLEKTFGPSPREFTSDDVRTAMNFSNAASCIRRSVWNEHPFVVIPAAEDREWANWAIDRGYRIVYDAGAAVYHSHTESCRKAAWRIIEIERTADLARASKRTPLLTIRQSVGWLVRDIRDISSVKADVRQKLICLTRTLRKCFWYAMDFNRLLPPDLTWAGAMVPPSQDRGKVEESGSTSGNMR